MRSLRPSWAVWGIALVAITGCSRDQRDDLSAGGSNLLPGTCEETTSPCGANADCITIGREHTCRCRDGYVLVGNVCQPVQHGSDAGNSSLRFGSCAATENGPCDIHARCSDVGIRYRCDCDAGYEGDGFTCRLVPATSCADRYGNCAPEADCEDTPSGPQCTCRPGYAGDGRSCELGPATDCSIRHGDCFSLADCTNTPQGPQCTCPRGYTGDGKTCDLVPAPDCSVRNGDCSSWGTCTDTPAGPQCTCPPGFTGDGQSCVWRDPCSEYNECDEIGAQCFSSYGVTEPWCQCRHPKKWGPDGRCVYCTRECDTANGEACLNEYLGTAVMTHTEIFECHCRRGWVLGTGGACQPICNNTDDCRWDGTSATCTRTDTGQETPCATPCTISTSICPSGLQCETDFYHQTYCR